VTTPDFSTIIPSKWKTWVGLIGSLLSFAVPLILSVEQYLPAPWPAVIGAVLAVLTALGIYKAPYVPQEAVLAPDTPAVAAAAAQPPAESGTFQNPWQ
jgi:hypothetical protein